MQQILQIEYRILAERYIFIHDQMMIIDDLFAIELVPDGTIIEICRRQKHLVCIFGQCQHTAFADRTFF